MAITYKDLPKVGFSSMGGAVLGVFSLLTSGLRGFCQGARVLKSKTTYCRNERRIPRAAGFRVEGFELRV